MSTEEKLELAAPRCTPTRRFGGSTARIVASIGSTCWCCSPLRHRVLRDIVHARPQLHLPADFNAQFTDWIESANQRAVRTLKARPIDLVDADRAAMLALPPGNR